MNSNLVGRTMKVLTLLGAVVFLAGFNIGQAETPGVELLKFSRVVEEGGQNSEELPYDVPNGDKGTIQVEKGAALDLGDIKEAFAYSDSSPGSAHVIGVRFTDMGAKKFAVITKELVGKRLAIVVKNRVVSAPTIMEPISGGRAVISGNFSESEAKALSTEINEALKK